MDDILAAASEGFSKLGAAQIELLAAFVEGSPKMAAAMIRAVGGMLVAQVSQNFAHAPVSAPPDGRERDTIAPGAAAGVMGLGLDDKTNFVGDPDGKITTPDDLSIEAAAPTGK